MDFAGIIDYYAIESPPPGADDETTLAFIEHQYSGEFGGFPARFPYWPYGQRDYIPQINWYPYVGFDIWSVDQFAYAGVQFSRSNSGDLRTYDVALGQFSRGATAGALATCDCDQPDIRTYGETDYYVWGTEGIGVIKKRNSPPLYDHLGRGPRLLVEDGRAFWTVFDAEMEDLIDVLAGAASSLADDPAYVEAVRLSASLGLIRDMSISSRNLSLAEAVASSWADGIETVAQKAPLLKPFGIVAVSSGFDGERPFFGIVIGGHEDAASAVENSKTLLDRLSKVPKGGPNDAPWSELLELVEISVQGDYVVARMYYRDPLMRSGYTADGFLLFNTLFIHE